MTITQVKENLIGMSHSGTLNKVRNIEAALERAANTMLAKIDPVETERIVPLAEVIHDDLYNYPLPSDYKKPIDLYPQDNRSNLDVARRTSADRFDFGKAIKNKQITIEGNEGEKFMRVNWKSSPAKTLNAMNSLTDNGTWSGVATATGLKAQAVYKISGNASIEFDIVASGDGIQNTTMTSVDLTDEDELADVIFPIYIGDSTKVTSVTAVWGNDLATNYWTSVAQTTQADGTSFRNGWNWVKMPWSTATETGTVAPATIDSFKVTLVTTGALSDVRVDNIIFSLGRPFDFKYYSKYIIKNSAGTLITRTASDDDTVILGSDSINIYLFESLKAIAQQIEGEDSSFDINFANRELYGDPNALSREGREGLYARYKAEHPTEAKKAVNQWSGGPRFRR